MGHEAETDRKGSKAASEEVLLGPLSTPSTLKPVSLARPTLHNDSVHFRQRFKANNIQRAKIYIFVLAKIQIFYIPRRIGM